MVIVLIWYTLCNAKLSLCYLSQLSIYFQILISQRKHMRDLQKIELNQKLFNVVKQTLKILNFTMNFYMTETIYLEEVKLVKDLVKVICVKCYDQQ